MLLLPRLQQASDKAFATFKRAEVLYHWYAPHALREPKSMLLPVSANLHCSSATFDHQHHSKLKPYASIMGGEAACEMEKCLDLWPHGQDVS